MRVRTFGVLLLLLSCIHLSAQNRYWVATGGATNWNNTANWSTTSGGAGGASVPGAGNTVFFDANGNANCNIDVAVNIGGLSINAYVGIIDLLGFTFTSAGNISLVSGTVNDTPATGTFIVSSTGTTTFSGTIFGAVVNVTSNRIQLSGSTFNATTTITKSAGGNDNGAGGNTFNGTTTIVNNGTGILRLAFTNPDIFNGQVTFTNSGTNDIDVAYNAATTFNGNVIVNQINSGSDLAFGRNTGTATLAAGNTISVGGTGFTIGDLELRNFTQTGATAQTLTMTGTSRLIMLTGSTWNADLNFTAPRIYFNGSTFNGNSTFTKNGAGSDASTGNNIFNGNTTINNSGTGYTLLANTTEDDFNGNLDLNSSGSSLIYVGYNGATTTIDGDVTMTSTGSSTGIRFGDAAGSVTLGATFTMNIGGGGFTSGTLRIEDFTQTGATAQTMTVGGSATLDIQDSNWGGNVDFTSGRLVTRNTVYSGTVSLEKTGAGNDLSIGGNTITGDATLTNSAGAQFRMGGTNPDAFNANVVMNNTGTSLLAIADGSAGNTIAGNLTGNNSASNVLRIANPGTSSITVTGTTTLSNTGTSLIYVANAGSATFNSDIDIECTNGTGIRFGESAGSTTISAGNTITIFGGGFTSSILRLRNVTQLGAVAMNLTLTGTGRMIITDSDFGGNVTFTSPRITMAGTTFNGTATIEKTGASDDVSTGGNTFSSTTTITNSGSNYLLMANVSPDTYNGDVVFDNTGTDEIYVAHNSAGNVFNGNATFNNSSARFMRISVNAAASSTFNGNVVVTNTAGTEVTIGGTTGGSASMAVGNTISVGGAGFTQGTLNLRAFTQNGNTPQTITTTGTAIVSIRDSSWDGVLTVTSPRFNTRSTTYNNNVTFTKNGASSDDSYGGNIFNGSTTITNSGSGRLRFATTAADDFNGTTDLTSSGSNDIDMAYGAGNTTFDGQLRVNSTGSSLGITFGDAGGSATLASGFTIAVGGGGFSAGTLLLEDFTQLGATAQTIGLTGTGLLNIFDTSWDGDVTFSGPRIFLRTSTFNGTGSFQKTGGTSDDSYGGNTFNDDVILTNTGTARMRMAATQEDDFNGNLTLNNSSTNRLDVGHNAGATTIDGNVVMNNTGSATGIYLGDGTGSVTLGAGFTFSIGGSGFNTGTLRFEDVTQVGATAQNLVLTNVAYMQVDNCSWGGDVTFTSPRFISSTTLYSGTATLQKTGAGNDDSNGGNTFNGVLTAIHNGSNRFRFGTNVNDAFNTDATFRLLTGGDLYFADDNANTFGGDLTLDNQGSGTLRLANGGGSTATVSGNATFSNTGTGIIYISNAATAATTINGNITVESTGGAGVLFGNGGGATTLAAGQTITIGGAGYTTGTLRLRNFTQTGATAQALTLTGTALLEIRDASWGGNVTFTSPRFTTRGTTYSGDATFEKTGTGDNASAGGNTFNGTTTVTNSASNYILFGNGSPDTFNGDAIFNNNGTDEIWVAYNSVGNVFNGTTTFNNNSSRFIYVTYAAASTSTFNGDIVVNNTSGIGIGFGIADGTTTLAAGNTVSIGGGGFATGRLTFEDFIQLGATAQTVTLTGTGYLWIEDSNWNGTVTLSGPRLQNRENTYNGVTQLTKSGGTNDDWAGSNTYNASVTITHAGANRLRLSNTGGFVSDYNGNVTYEITGTGTFQPSRANSDTYAGDLTIDSNINLTFGIAGGGLIFDGGGAQSFNNIGSATSHIFNRLEMNNTVDELTLNHPATVNVSLTMTNGNIITTSVNLLSLGTTATSTSGSDDSYVEGPMRKSGNVDFEFPVGKGGEWQRIGVSGYTGGSNTFEAEFFNNNPNDDGYDPFMSEAALNNVSGREYWILDRISGGSNVFVTLHWDDAGLSEIDDLADIRVARWNTGDSEWKDEGRSGTTGGVGAGVSGSVTSAAVVTTFSPFSFGSALSSVNPLPIELLSFEGIADQYWIELLWSTASEFNNDYFVVERSQDGLNFIEVLHEDGAGNSNEILEYSRRDLNPLSGISYYRLKQVDFDGTFTYSQVIRVVFEDNRNGLILYPNPNTGDRVNLRFANIVEDAEFEVTITDLAGKIILHDRFNVFPSYPEISIKLNGSLESGYYVISATNNLKKFTGKLIVRE